MLKHIKRLLLILLAPSVISVALFGQAGKLTLTGQVTDSSGASIPAATVTATGPGGTTLSAQTDEQGRYAFHNLAPGAYTVRIQIQGFTPFEKSGIEVVAGGKAPVVDAQLEVSMAKQQVTVQSEGQQLSVNPESNASTLVLRGEALNSLSEDPDELQQELLALAGPAAGPNGGQIYIDGFTGGQLPPKEAILEVRVNQNPFSAQYERLGYGRIDIITKPGYQKFHGGLYTYGNNSMFNSRNPFVGQEPNYHSEFINGNVGGPIGKKASFFFNMYHRKTIDNSIVTAVVLNPNTFNPTSLNEAVRSPQTRNNYSPRFDFQLSSKNVLTVRGEFSTNESQNNGVGQMSLPSLASNSSGHGNELHISDTQIVSTRTVTQLLFGWESNYSNQVPFSLDPTVRVNGAFTGGGSSGGTSQDTSGHYEIRSTTSMTLGKHSVTYGGEVRHRNDSVNTFGGYNGAFTFPTLQAYQITEQGLAQGLTPAQIRAAGGEPSQFTITAGNPVASVGVTDLALFGEDTWRVRPNVSLTYGLRFETQNQINDHADFAPRLGIAWGLGHSAAPKTVLRAGFGMFYDRFGVSRVLQLQQLNGINQQRYIVAPPSPGALQVLDLFPAVPPVGTLGSFLSSQTVYRLDPHFRSPYTIQAATSIERQIGNKVTASVTYIKSHGAHQLLTNNINAPLPGTYVACAPGNPSCTPSAGIRPFGNVGNIYQYEAVGNFNEDQVITNFNVNAGSSMSFSGYYTLSYGTSDTNGGFPMNPYNIRADYGPASFVTRNQFFLRATFGLPLGIEFDPFLVANSGSPYNVTLGQDLNGDSNFNDRPAIAAPGATGPNIVATQFGTFNIAPALGAPVIPVNYLTGPSRFSVNAHISRTFGFGRVTESAGGGGGLSGGGGYHGHGHGHGGGLGSGGLSSSGGSRGFLFSHNDANSHRYQVEVGASVHNLFNQVNLGTPVGNVTSPLFGQSISLASGFFGGQAANRSIDFTLRFRF
jgi:Carboxypeptidase regulatory-like domain